MWSFKKSFTVSFAIAAVLLLGRYYVYKKDYRISGLLQDVVDFINRLDTAFIKAVELTYEDPYKDLTDDRVNPAFKKISSLQEEIEIYYEKYRDTDPASGELDKLVSKVVDTTASVSSLIPDFKTENRNVVSKIKREISGLQKEYADLIEGLDNVFDDKTLNILESVGIFLNEPSEESTKDDTFLGVIKEKIEHLHKKFVELENVHDQSSEKANHETKVDDSDKIKESLIKEINAISSANEQLLRQTMPKIGEKWKELEDVVNKIVEHQQNMKIRYEALIQDVETDLLDLKDKLIDIRPTKKITDEL